MQCPDCRVELANDAMYCGCGWKRDKVTTDGEPLRVECAHMACQFRAKVKVKTPTGLANFCRHHYDDYFLTQAQETCKNLGLETLEQKRAYALKALKRINFAFPDRQPGEDENYTYLQA